MCIRDSFESSDNSDGEVGGGGTGFKSLYLLAILTLRTVLTALTILAKVAGGGLGSSFVPFGSVVAASGCSVRVSVACSAGLAASLPLWGLKMRGDSDWAVRAVFPKKVVLLQEGERALVQAELHDADGRGLPSTERLLKAVVLATPAMELPLLKAVAVSYTHLTLPTTAIV